MIHYDQIIFDSFRMWTLQQKQKYLREQITEQKYQQFWGFIDQEVGNYDLEKWENSFIINLVQRFKLTLVQSHLALQTSFYQYQANQKPESPSTLTESILNSKPQVESKPVVKQVEFKKNTKNFAFLDQMVTKVDPVKEKQEEPSAHHFKTYSGCSTQKKIEHLQPNNVFATNQVKVDQNQKGHKVIKNNNDFSSFDFWSQPSSSKPNSPEQNKSVFDDFLSFTQTPKQTKPNKSPSVPSFDQLIVNCQQSKGPSPYTKKNNPDQVVVNKLQPPKPVVTSKSLSKMENKVAKPVVKPPEKKVQVPVPAVPVLAPKNMNTKKKTGKVLYDGEVVIKNSFESRVKCFPSTQRKKLMDPQLSIHIQGHQIIQRTFLMPDYTMYTIRLDPLGSTCKRNYEDFSKLKSILSKLFPTTKLAYLQKNAWFSSTSQEFIKEQTIMLEFFLNDLLQNKEIRNSRIFQDFLMITQHKKIKRKFEDWQKLQTPQGIEDLCLLSGNVDINISEQQRIYHDKFIHFHQKIIDFLKKQQKLTATLMEQWSEVDKTQEQLTNLVKSMIDQTIYFNERVYDLQIQQIKKTLQTLHRCYIQDNKNTKFSMQIAQTMIIPFVNYEKSNISELEQLIDKQQSFFKSYLKRSNYDKEQENLPYSSEKVKAYKTGVLDQSKNFMVFKYQTGHLSNQLCLEAHRVIDTLAMKYNKLIKQCARKCRDQYEQTLEFWSQGLYNRIGLA